MSHGHFGINLPNPRAVYLGMDYEDPRGLAVDQRPGFAEQIRRSDMAVQRPSSTAELLHIADRRIAHIAQNDPVVQSLEIEREKLKGLSPEQRAHAIEQKVAELGAEYLNDSFWQRALGCTYAEAPLPARALGLQIIEVRIATLFGLEPSKVLLASGVPGQASFDRQDNLMLFAVREVLFASQEDVLRSLFHEQSHRLQFEAIDNPRAFPQYSEREIGSWQDNLRPGVYIRGGVLASEQFAYENQPVERHAIARAEQLIGRVYEFIKQQHRA